MPAQEPFSSYLFEYNHDGSRWGFEVQAKSEADARERISKMQFATYCGEVYEKIPVALGPVAGFLCWCRNLKASPKRS